MTTEDDRIRQALSRGEPSFTAHSALEQLRPTMQRARLRRRVAAGAATLALLAGGSAGALALATTRNPPTLRTVSDDETGRSILPEPTTIPTTSPTTTPTPEISAAPPPVVPASEPVVSSVAPDVDNAVPVDDNGRSPGPQAPAPTIAPPPAPPPPAPAPVAVSQTIASDCGDVLVAIENGAVRIVSITARPGYESASVRRRPDLDRDRSACRRRHVRTPRRTQVRRAGRRSAELNRRPLMR